MGHPVLSSRPMASAFRRTFGRSFRAFLSGRAPSAAGRSQRGGLGLAIAQASSRAPDGLIECITRWASLQVYRCSSIIPTDKIGRPGGHLNEINHWLRHPRIIRTNNQRRFGWWLASSRPALSTSSTAVFARTARKQFSVDGSCHKIFVDTGWQLQSAGRLKTRPRR